MNYANYIETQYNILRCIMDNEEISKEFLDHLSGVNMYCRNHEARLITDIQYNFSGKCPFPRFIEVGNVLNISDYEGLSESLTLIPTFKTANISINIQAEDNNWEYDPKEDVFIYKTINSYVVPDQFFHPIDAPVCADNIVKIIFFGTNISVVAKNKCNFSKTFNLAIFELVPEYETVCDTSQDIPDVPISLTSDNTETEIEKSDV